jgi:hypothetical protein
VPLYLQPLEDSLVQRLQRYGTFSRLKQVSFVCLYSTNPYLERG